MQIKNYPKHLAIIPDGNRRWARKLGRVPWEGHREGMKRFREVSEEAFRIGIPYLTFWAASTDNLIKRSLKEVAFLTAILKEELKNRELFERSQEYGARLRVIGRWSEILQDEELSRAIKDLEEKTQSFSKRHLTILFGYDGREEMLEAINKLKIANPETTQAGRKIDETDLRRKLWTGDLPEVDLVIRTGGEPHWSAGFMMWLTANSQFYFTEKFWPEFTKKELQKALEDYVARERRYGK